MDQCRIIVRAGCVSGRRNLLSRDTRPRNSFLTFWRMQFLSWTGEIQGATVSMYDAYVIFSDSVRTVRVRYFAVR